MELSDHLPIGIKLFKPSEVIITWNILNKLWIKYLQPSLKGSIITDNREQLIIKNIMFIIEKHNPMILCLQEVSPEMLSMLKFTGYGYINRNESSHNYELIMYDKKKLKLIRVKHIEFSKNDNDWHMHAEFLYHDLPIYVINTHIPWSENMKYQRELANYKLPIGIPVLICGDFNCSVDNMRKLYDIVDIIVPNHVRGDLNGAIAQFDDIITPGYKHEYVNPSMLGFEKCW